MTKPDSPVAPAGIAPTGPVSDVQVSRAPARLKWWLAAALLVANLLLIGNVSTSSIASATGTTFAAWSDGEPPEASRLATGMPLVWARHGGRTYYCGGDKAGVEKGGDGEFLSEIEAGARGMAPARGQPCD